MYRKYKLNYSTLLQSLYSLYRETYWIFEILLMLNLGVCTGYLKVKYHDMCITPDELDFINEFRPRVKKIN